MVVSSGVRSELPGSRVIPEVTQINDPVSRAPAPGSHSFAANLANIVVLRAVVGLSGSA
jgi:hypothetical protein